MTDLQPNRGAYSVRAIRGVLWSIVNAVIPSLASFFVFVVISRYIGPTEFGVVALTGSIVALAGIFVPSGFAEAIVQRADVDDTHLDSVFWTAFCCALVTYLVLMACSGLLGQLLRSERITELLPIAGLRLISDAAGLVPQAIISRRMSFELIAGRTLLATFVSALLTVLLLVTGYSVWALVIAQSLSSVVATLASMWGARWRPGFMLTSTALRALARYGIFSSGTRAIQALTTQADPAIVGLYLGQAQVGIYAFSRSIFQMILNVIAGPLGSVAHPMLSTVQEDRDRVRRGFLTATFLSSALSFPLLVGFVLVADVAVPLLFGSRWIEAIWPIRIYCGLGTMACVGVIQGSLINSRGQSDWWFYYQLAAGLVTILILVGASHFGVTPLLFTILLATAARWPFAVIKSARLISLSMSEYLTVFAGPAAACLVMTVFVLGVRLAVSDLPPALALSTYIVIGAASYLGAIFVLARKRVTELLDLLRSSVGIRR